MNDMTGEEAIKFFGKDVWKKMLNTGLLTGITGKINKSGEFIIYACDLNNAYHAVKTGKMLFID